MKKKFEVGKCYKSKGYFNIFKVISVDTDGKVYDISGCNKDGLYAKSILVLTPQVDCAVRYEEVSVEKFDKAVEDFLDEFKRGHMVVTLEKKKR